MCGRRVGTHREPINDNRLELVVYHQHDDTLRKPCRMSDKRAAIGAVAFTSVTDAGAFPIREYREAIA
ncbi:hypothetical protein AWC13_16505 [Mycobacterium kubicae]|nr:hypothetical protein AWC13_16505 [Mycobacterium kubicae]